MGNRCCVPSAGIRSKPEPRPAATSCFRPTSINHDESVDKDKNGNEKKKRNQQEEEEIPLILMISPDHNINNMIPNDLLFEILLRLNQNHAIQCKLVCKQWYSLISSPTFTNCLNRRHCRIGLIYHIESGWFFRCSC